MSERWLRTRAWHAEQPKVQLPVAVFVVPTDQFGFSGGRTADEEGRDVLTLPRLEGLRTTTTILLANRGVKESSSAMPTVHHLHTCYALAMHVWFTR